MYLIPYATFSDNYHYAFSRKVFFLRDRAGQGVGGGWGGTISYFPLLPSLFRNKWPCVQTVAYCQKRQQVLNQHLLLEVLAVQKETEGAAMEQHVRIFNM